MIVYTAISKMTIFETNMITNAEQRKPKIDDAILNI